MAMHPTVAAHGAWLTFVGASGARARRAWAAEIVLAEIGKRKKKTAPLPKSSLASL
jgi:hypothetical protein